MPILKSHMRRFLQTASAAAFILSSSSLWAASRYVPEALETRRVSLENDVDTYFNWLLAFTLVVAIGVVLEVPEELPTGALRTRRGRLQWKYRSWPKRLTRWGAIVVAVGVTGEAVFEGLLAYTETDLRKANNEIIVSLEQQLAPRALDDSERQAVGEELRQFATSFVGRKVIVSSYSADAEGIVFSLQIVDILTRAGINIEPVIGRMIPIGLVDFGVKITGPIADQSFIKSLATGINSRLDTRFVGEWNDKYTEVRVDVGAKPIPGLPDIRLTPPAAPALK